MKYSWAVNLYDKDGDAYEECVLVFLGEYTTLRFRSPEDLKDFANAILKSIPEIEENWEE